MTTMNEATLDRLAFRAGIALREVDLDNPAVQKPWADHVDAEHVLALVEEVRTLRAMRRTLTGSLAHLLSQIETKAVAARSILEAL